MAGDIPRKLCRPVPCVLSSTGRGRSYDSVHTRRRRKVSKSESVVSPEASSTEDARRTNPRVPNYLTLISSRPNLSDRNLLLDALNFVVLEKLIRARQSNGGLLTRGRWQCPVIVLFIVRQCFLNSGPPSCPTLPYLLTASRKRLRPRLVPIRSHSAAPFPLITPNWPLSELSSVALGGQVISVSDEFFADAFHLLLVEVCPFRFPVPHSCGLICSCDPSPPRASKGNLARKGLFSAAGRPADTIRHMTGMTPMFSLLRY